MQIINTKRCFSKKKVMNYIAITNFAYNMTPTKQYIIIMFKSKKCRY